jgi:hypothetical protein
MPRPLGLSTRRWRAGRRPRHASWKCRRPGSRTSRTSGTTTSSRSGRPPAGTPPAMTNCGRSSGPCRSCIHRSVLRSAGVQEEAVMIDQVVVGRDQGPRTTSNRQNTDPNRVGAPSISDRLGMGPDHPPCGIRRRRHRRPYRSPFPHRHAGWRDTINPVNRVGVIRNSLAVTCRGSLITGTASGHGLTTITSELT